MYATIINGAVAELHTEAPALAPGESAFVVSCADVAQPGWAFLGGQVVEPSAENMLEQQIQKITGAYEVKRESLKDRMGIALLQDGANETAIRTALVAEWQQLNADEEQEILLLFGG